MPDPKTPQKPEEPQEPQNVKGEELDDENLEGASGGLNSGCINYGCSSN